MNGFIWALLIQYWLALYVGNVWLCYTIAEQKNRNEVLWGWVAVLFGIPATLIVAALPPLKMSLLARTAAKIRKEKEEMQEEIKQHESARVGFSHPKK